MQEVPAQTPRSSDRDSRSAPASAGLPRFCDPAGAADLLERLGAEFAVLRNPAYIHPPFELVPLAPKVVPPISRLRAVVCDMDGTTTTTEPLCLHSLEFMIRRMSRRLSADDWIGLSDLDHPHVIGNSTTRHVEYLIQTYGDWILPEATASGLAEACAWTIQYARDPLRRRDATAAAALFGVEPAVRFLSTNVLPDDPVMGIQAIADRRSTSAEFDSAIAAAIGQGVNFSHRDPNIVRAAIEIYYSRYHQILEHIQRGTGAELAGRILGDAGRRLVEPMPGVALFLSAIKGWLTSDLAAELFDAECSAQPQLNIPDTARARFLNAVDQLHRQPARVAVVTSSIHAEARVVLNEVFDLLRGQIADWPIPSADRDRLQDGFSSPEEFYDAYITASDSTEIRLKPHRDLYSLALHRLGLAPAEFNEVLGLEDSESGVLSIRAAGVGLCVAVPFTETLGHDLRAAARVNPRGLPQVMFEDFFFLDV